MYTLSSWDMKSQQFTQVVTLGTAIIPFIKA